MLALVGIGNVAAHVRVIVHEHATDAECDVVRDTADNSASVPALIAGRVTAAVSAALLASEQPSEHDLGTHAERTFRVSFYVFEMSATTTLSFGPDWPTAFWIGATETHVAHGNLEAHCTSEVSQRDTYLNADHRLCHLWHR
jgi:hypothetical protein